MTQTITIEQLPFIELLKLIALCIGILISTFTIIQVIFGKFIPWIRLKLSQKKLYNKLRNSSYTIDDIKNASKFFIEPDCQSVDPAGGDEPNNIIAARENLFIKMDVILKNPSQYKYIIMLADSGMGKTTFLFNYYGKHLRTWWKKYDIVLLPLNNPDTDDKIKNVENKKSTVLFLDALDEDTKAISNHTDRISQIVSLTKDFQKIVITCRTQFFPSDEEIPRETGIIKCNPRNLGEKSEYVFHKLYFSPFNDKQINKYLKKRYFGFWNIRKRKKAREIVKRTKNIMARPMLLAHIDELIKSNKNIVYLNQIYEEIIGAWILREEGILGIKGDILRDFSEKLAVDIYNNKISRGSEKVHRNEMLNLAKTWGFSVDDWKLTGRSLLNRDAIGNYKFSHRSILEYLYVYSFLVGNFEHDNFIQWTDQMKIFALDILKTSQVKNLKKIDLSCCHFLNIDLSNTNCYDADFSGSIFIDVTFKNCSFKNTNFSKAQISYSNFCGSEFLYTNLEKVTFHNVILEGINFKNCNLKDLFTRDNENIPSSVKYPKGTYIKGCKINGQPIEKCKEFISFTSIDINKNLKRINLLNNNSL